MKSIHTVRESGLLLEANRCVHLAKSHQVEMDTCYGISRGPGKEVLSSSPRYILLHSGTLVK